MRARLLLCCGSQDSVSRGHLQRHLWHQRCVFSAVQCGVLLPVGLYLCYGGSLRKCERVLVRVGDRGVG